MELKELKQKSKVNVLFRGPSGRGKTLNACKVALTVSRGGGRVMYADTEGEGSTTMVNLIEEGSFEEGDLENIDYKKIGEYDEVMELVEKSDKYDLLIFDTLDSKHTMVLKEITDAKNKADADWNQYPFIYSGEKQMMKEIRDTECNVICCLDPESGNMDKPKLCQTNVHGAFGIVIDLGKSGEEWTTKIINYVGRSDAVGKSPNNLVEKLSEEVLERVET